MRTCQGCDWVFPSSYNRTKCKFCGHPFPDKYCTLCNQLKPLEAFSKYGKGYSSRCLECDKARWKQRDKDNPLKFSERTLKAYYKRRKKAFDKYEAIKNIKIDFKPLTEDEWLKICEYFGGCAVCGNEHIEVREFFIRRAEGGQYTPWNMFPMCGKCATRTRIVDNPFLWMDLHKGTARRMGLNEERYERLENFFIMQIERYSHERKN